MGGEAPDQMSESTVKAAVRKLLDEFKCFYTMPVPSGYGESMLDFVGHHEGLYFEIETKDKGKKPTPRQGFRVDNIRESGAMAFVIGEVWGPHFPDGHIYSGMYELEQWLKRK